MAEHRVNWQAAIGERWLIEAGMAKGRVAVPCAILAGWDEESWWISFAIGPFFVSAELCSPEPTEEPGS